MRVTKIENGRISIEIRERNSIISKNNPGCRYYAIIKDNSSYPQGVTYLEEEDIDQITILLREIKKVTK